MQIVIEIDEERYEDTKRIASVQMNYRTPTIEQIVANGTPLPKGHGRLIDADWVLNKMSTTDAQPITPNEHYAWDFAETLFRNAPTIIEADTESEE